MMIVEMKATTPMKTAMMRIRIWIQFTAGAARTSEHRSTLVTENFSKTSLSFLFFDSSKSLLTLSKSTTSSSCST